MYPSLSPSRVDCLVHIHTYTCIYKQHVTFWPAEIAHTKHAPTAPNRTSSSTASTLPSPAQYISAVLLSASRKLTSRPSSSTIRVSSAALPDLAQSHQLPLYSRTKSTATYCSGSLVDDHRQVHSLELVLLAISLFSLPNSPIVTIYRENCYHVFSDPSAHSTKYSIAPSGPGRDETIPLTRPNSPGAVGSSGFCSSIQHKTRFLASNHAQSGLATSRQRKTDRRLWLQFSPPFYLSSKQIDRTYHASTLPLPLFLPL